MAILNLNESQFAELLKEVVFPARPIKQIEYLHDRDGQARTVRQALHTDGMHIFISGERGVGKSSLAHSVVKEFGVNFISLNCMSDFAFIDIINSIISRINDKRGLFNVDINEISFLGFSAKGSSNNKTPLHLEFFDAIKTNFSGDNPLIVILDEFDRIEDEKVINSFAELLKAVSENGDEPIPIKFVVCGVAETFQKTVDQHFSTHRCIRPVNLERLPFDGRIAIMEQISKKTNIKFDDDTIKRVAIISDGFPYYVHLIAKELLWAVFNDTKICYSINATHVEQALLEAAEQAERELVKAYDTATKKDKNDYKEVLWAVAYSYHLDKSTLDIRKDYMQIVSDLKLTPEQVLDNTQISARLNSLKKEGCGNILTSNQRSWFKFTENRMRGYVRLHANNAGVNLPIDHINPKRISKIAS